MILGTEARVRPLVELITSGTDIDFAKPRGWPLPDHRDRGHFLSARLYPAAPFDPWQPALSYVGRLDVDLNLDKELYGVASESM
jgi:hypothetical protein